MTSEPMYHRSSDFSRWYGCINVLFEIYLPILVYSILCTHMQALVGRSLCKSLLGCSRLLWCTVSS